MIFCKLDWSNIGIIPNCCKLEVPSSIFNALCQKVSILIEVWELYLFFDWSYFVYIKVNKLTFYNFYHFLGFFCLCKAIKKKFKSFPFFYWHLVAWRWTTLCKTSKRRFYFETNQNIFINSSGSCFILLSQWTYFPRKLFEEIWCSKPIV